MAGFEEIYKGATRELDEIKDKVFRESLLRSMDKNKEKFRNVPYVLAHLVRTAIWLSSNWDIGKLRKDQRRELAECMVKIYLRASFACHLLDEFFQTMRVDLSYLPISIKTLENNLKECKTRGEVERMLSALCDYYRRFVR